MDETVRHSNRRIESQIQMAEAYCDAHTNEAGVGTHEVGIIRSLISRIMEADELIAKQKPVVDAAVELIENSGPFRGYDGYMSVKIGDDRALRAAVEEFKK